MKLSSLTTKLFLILAAAAAFAFNGDDESVYFSLTSGKIFSPGDPHTSVQISSNGLDGGVVEFRAFKIQDPVTFFLGQKDPHSPTLAVASPPNTFDMIDQGFNKVKQDARYAARSVMPAEARAAIRDVGDLNGVKAEARKKKDNPGKVVYPSGDEIPAGAESFPIVAHWQYNVQKQKDQWSYGDVIAPIKEKGVYLIEARARGRRAITVLVISEAGMVVKQADTKALSFVMNRKTGEKISGFPLVYARAGEKIGSNQTGSDGVSTLTVPPVTAKKDTSVPDEEQWRWEERQHQVLIVGEKDGNFVISDPYYYGSEASQNYQVYLHTDRPVYRPDQSVYYRGIVRKVTEDGTYENVTGKKVFVEITDARDGSVKKDTLSLSDMGTFNGQIDLGHEPPLGDYSIKATVEGSEHYFNFSVEEYKKPEYKVVVTTDKQQYTRGDVISATAKADYFFGSPVTNAKVEYFVYRSQYWRPWWRGSEWAYLYEEGDDFATYRMEMVNSGEGTLNADGTFKFSYQTDPKADKDYVYRVQANVVDNSRRSISGAKSVEVTRGEFYITATTDKYVYQPNDQAKIAVTIATFDGDKPVAIPFSVKVQRTWWDRSGESGNYKYTEHKETKWTGNGSTGADGKGTVNYTPTQPGYFELLIEARDNRGTSITESSYIYVSDNAYADWYREGSSDVQIIPDKESYTPGETMNALVIMPSPNVDALITTEGATLYSHSVEHLTANSAIVHVPIEDKFAPVFFLNASTIVNDQMYSESHRITVVPKGKLIHIEVQTDKAQYKPGEKGSVTVKATDEAGKPVENTEIALAMVDEAVYSIKPESTPDIQKFFYGNRWNSVSTTSSLQFNFYANARKMKGGDVLFGANREAAAPRSGMFANAAIRQNLAFGDVKGEMFIEPALRKTFKDMMFWTPSARTDGSGVAHMDVQFPDNLTTWRITARGVTKNTAVGQAVARVIARKNLLVRMETPRFLIQGDELVIATTIHNYLKDGKTAKVQISGQNATFNESEKTITIAANGEQRIDWKLTAPQTGSATLTVKALTNEESDAVQLTVPVLPRGLRIAKSQTAEIDEQAANRSISLPIPDNSDPNASELYVSVSPSIAGTLMGSLDALIGYPYGCVEQTMSKFLPTVVVADVLKQLDVPFDAKKRAELPKMVGSGLSKLYGMQHGDGGWGWWTNDQTDAFMTAYVVYGMYVAKQSGFGVDDDRFQRGTAELRTIFNSRKSPNETAKGLTGATEAYQAYVLSLLASGKADKGLQDRVSALGRTDSLNNYSKALVALAAASQGNNQLALGLANRLEAAATSNGDVSYWSGKQWHYNWEDDQVETSAAVIKALLTIKGEDDVVRRGIRWIMAQKEGDSWHNTRQTAMVVYSFVDYLKKSHELDPNYAYSVKVNGREVQQGHFSRSDIFQPERMIKVSASNLQKGQNVVSIEKNGAGRLYSTSRVVYYATGAGIQPANGGFKVSREYSLLKKEKKGDIYVYNKRPFLGSLKSGDELLVKVKVTPNTSYEYFMLEDPLPAGCEVITSTEGYTIPGEPDYDEKAREKRGYYGWYWWYADRNVRDDRVSFFARYISPKPYEFTYILRAQIPGKYSVMPAVASLMYYPEVRGNSGLNLVSIGQ